jgi:hypothetical protein
MLVDMSSVAACMVVSLPSLIDRLPINAHAHRPPKVDRL